MESGGKHPFSILHFGLVLSKTLPINYYFIIFHVNIVLAFILSSSSVFWLVLSEHPAPDFSAFILIPLPTLKCFIILLLTILVQNIIPMYFHYFHVKLAFPQQKLPITHLSGQTNVWHSFIDYIHHNYCWKISFPLKKNLIFSCTSSQLTCFYL